MKTSLLILIISMLGIGGSSFAQGDNMYPSGSPVSIPDILQLPDFPYHNGEVAYQSVHEFDADQKTLYGIALRYVSDYYKSAKSVIDVADPDNGLVIVKGIFTITSDVYYRFFGTQKSANSYLTYHTLKIECKDNKIRATISNLRAELQANPSLGIVTTEIPIKQLISLYNQYGEIKKPKKRETMAQVNRSFLLDELDLNAYNFLSGLEPYFAKQLTDDW